MILFGAAALIITVFFALIIPFEVLLAVVSASAIAADIRGVEELPGYSYLRFVPHAILFLRGAFAILYRRAPKRRLPITFLLPFGAFTVLALFSALYAANVELTILRACSLFFLIFGLGLGLTACADRDDSIEDLLRPTILLIALVVAACLLSMPFTSHGLVEYDLQAGPRIVRVRGFFGNPNTLGLLAMLTFFPLAIFCSRERGLRRFALALLFLSNGAALIASGSRAALAGVLAGFVALALTKFRRSLNPRALLVLVVLGLAAAVAVFSGAIPALSRTDTGLRPDLWARAIELGLRAPVLGVGWGSVDDVFQADRAHLAAIGVGSGGSHNEYLRVFVGLGGLGLFIAIAGFGWILVRGVRTIHRDQSSPMVAGVFALVIAGLLNGAFEDWIFAVGGAPAVPFWIGLALLALEGENIHVWYRGMGRARRYQRGRSAAPREDDAPAHPSRA